MDWDDIIQTQALTLRDGDLLVIRCMHPEILMPQLNALTDWLNANGMTKVAVGIFHHDVRLEHIDPQVMADLGWVYVGPDQVAKTKCAFGAASTVAVRQKEVRVSPEFLKMFVSEGAVIPPLMCVEGIPRTAQFVRGRYDAVTQEFRLVFEDSNFDLVPPGQDLPQVRARHVNLAASAPADDDRSDR